MASAAQDGVNLITEGAFEPVPIESAVGLRVTNG